MPAPGAPGTPEAPAAAGRAGRTRKAPTPGPGAAGGRAPAAETASAGASPTRAPLANVGNGADPFHSAHTVDAAVSRPGLSTPLGAFGALCLLWPPTLHIPGSVFPLSASAGRSAACPLTSPTRPLAALVFRRPVRLGSSAALPSAGHPLSALPQPPSAPFSAAWPFATSLVSPGPLLRAQTAAWLAARLAGRPGRLRAPRVRPAWVPRNTAPRLPRALGPLARPASPRPCSEFGSPLAAPPLAAERRVPILASSGHV